MMGSLGHNIGFAQMLKVRVHGFPAWFFRRTYYLLQMPGWSRRLRMMIDWTFGLLLRPDIVKVRLTSEAASLLCETSHLETRTGAQKPGGSEALTGSLKHAAAPGQVNSAMPAPVYLDSAAS
jgi:hypothetical protein